MVFIWHRLFRWAPSLCWYFVAIRLVLAVSDAAAGSDTASVSVQADGSVEVEENPGEGLCCFTPDDITLVRMDKRPHLSNILSLQVDNFLCQDALDAILESAKTAKWKDDGKTFPGYDIEVKPFIKTATEKGKVYLDRLSKYQHVDCLRRAWKMLEETGRVPAAKRWSAEEWHAKEETSHDLIKRLKHYSAATKTNKKKVREEMMAKVDEVIKEMEDEGLTDPYLISAEGIGHTLHSKKLEASHPPLFSFVTRNSTMSPVHKDVDTGFVFNLHLTPGFEDSSTAFFGVKPANPKKPKKDDKLLEKYNPPCFGNLTVVDGCDGFMVYQNRFRNKDGMWGILHKRQMGRLAITAEMPQKQNRMYLFPGQYPHSAFFSEDAARRAQVPGHDQYGYNADVPRRMVLQHFISSPNHLVNGEMHEYFNQWKNQKTMQR